MCKLIVCFVVRKLVKKSKCSIEHKHNYDNLILLSILTTKYSIFDCLNLDEVGLCTETLDLFYSLAYSCTIPFILCVKITISAIIIESTCTVNRHQSSALLL